jgi:hypothetical protein
MRWSAQLSAMLSAAFGDIGPWSRNEESWRPAREACKTPRMSRAYLCVSIDTECDRGPAWRSGRPLSFEGVHVGIVERLQPLFASLGAKPTYLVSPEVIRDDRCAQALRALDASCELGTRHDAERFENGMLPFFASPDEREQHELRSLTDQFIRAFEFQPVSFRARRARIGRRTIGLLEELGYAVESSVTPNVESLSERDGSSELSFTRAPTQPYRPDRDDPTRPGDSTMLEIPITIRRRFGSALPGIGKRFAPRWLRPTWMSGDALVQLAEDEIGDARRAAPGRPVILNAMLRATEVVPAASRHASLEGEARLVLDRVRELLAFARRESIAVIGLGDVPEVLQT